MNYNATGSFLSKGETTPFETSIDAENEKMAREKIFAQMGSKQGIKRMYILIKDIKAMK
ncbi:MAG: 50S ribosomal protein L18Ae [archaeon]